MLIEIYLTFAAISILLLVLGYIHLREMEGVFLLFLSCLFLLVCGYSSGDIELVDFGNSSVAITQTEHFGSLMMLFVALFLVAIALIVITLLNNLSGKEA